MTVVKAAAVQISPVLYSRNGTVDKVVDKIAELFRRGVQFATFPETVVPYYPYFSFVQRPFEMGYHERMIWGQGDGSGLRAVDSAVGRIGQLACWEHYHPLTRYAFSADGEQIHSAMFPGSFSGALFAEQTEISVRNHAIESGSFVVNATAWLDADQQAQIMVDTGSPIGAISGGSFTAIVSPLGELLGEPLRSGEGEVIADLDFALIDRRKAKMDSSGHYSRPELLSLMIDHTETANMHERVAHEDSVACAEVNYVHV